MCVLALILGRDPRTSLLVAANRDEFLARPSAPPAEIEPGIIAGKDLEAGGTWLGINRHGLFVAVTNRKTPARKPEGTSRGLLALEALRCRGLGGVEALVSKRTGVRPVAGFNLVAVMEVEGVCLHWDGSLRPVRFGPGTHVVSTDRDLDDPKMPEKERFDRFVASRWQGPDPRSLAEFLASHEGERAVCKHGEKFGTVSSTIYAVDDTGEHLFYADGPPCRAAFRDYSGLLQ